MSGDIMSNLKGVENIEEEIQRHVSERKDYLGRDVAPCRLSGLPAYVQDNVDRFCDDIDQR